MLSLVGILPAKQAAADIGPAPIYTQGGSLQTSSASTNVEMAYEKVTLTYSAPVVQDQYSAYMPVHVVATFRMNNTASAAERMNIYFPLSDDLFIGGYSGESTNITSFKVDGQTLSSGSITNVPTTINGKTQSMPAYQWQQTFNPGNTTINIEYDSKSGKDSGVFYLTYVLGTGRGWKGSIGSGEIDFVLPQKLTSYSVVSKAPKIAANKIPYKVSGNTITVPLSSYEPADDAVIALGVYDQATVAQIEQLKKQPSTYATSLSIAEKFRQLSIGPHCAFSTGDAATQAQNYYIQALDKSSSKAELDKVLASYAYGDTTDYAASVPKIFNFFTLAKDPDCNLTDFTCTTQAKEDQLFEMRDVPLWPGGTNKYQAFLTKYSCKVRAYDTAASTSVDTFLGAPSDCTVKKTEKPEVTANTKSTAKKDNKTKLILIASVAAAVVVIAALTTILVIRNKRRHAAQGDQPTPTKDEAKTPAAETTEKPKTK